MTDQGKTNEWTDEQRRVARILGFSYDEKTWPRDLIDKMIRLRTDSGERVFYEHLHRMFNP